MTEPFTDWPHVETDMEAWLGWAERATAPTIKLRKRPFLVRLRNHYRMCRALGMPVYDALYCAWRIARL